jgi:CRISPR-associated protein Cas1
MSIDGNLVRVMALHSLTYCERLYYLEEVEELRVANDAVFAGRTLHLEHGGADPTATEIRELSLSSESLGLQGKVDAVRTRDGALVPYEHKRGRARGGPNGPEAWPSDELQVAAYALLLEEDRGRTVPEGRVRYHADNVTVRVPITDDLRKRVYAAVQRTRELSQLVERPPVTDNPALCARCSLAPVCLPEEERFDRGSMERPLRLFPETDERKTLHVVSPGARVGRDHERLVVDSPGQDSLKVPINDVGALVLHGYAQVSTQALHLCADREVSIHWLTGGGRHVGALHPGSGMVQRRVRQYQALSEPGTALKLARRLTAAKMESQVRFLLRSSRQDEVGRKTVEPAIAAIRNEIKAAARCESLAKLRGFEGAAGHAYFGALPQLLLPSVRDLFGLQGRNRRPPQDPFNAALSFGYALLYRSVLAAILAVGLEPALGIFHTPRSAAHPLVLDLMELFRVSVWDITLVGSCNRQQWNDKDFDKTRDHVYLSESGRRKAIELYEKRLEDVWKHPVLNYSLSYGRSIELEVRLLEKEWTGSPGLFARSRLR